MTPKQQLFVRHYLETFNATEAARRAGYAGSDASLAVTGWRLLRNAKIQKHLSIHAATVAMKTDEILLRLSQMARGEEPTSTRVGPRGEAKTFDRLDALDKLARVHELYREPDPDYWRVEAVQLIQIGQVTFEMAAAEFGHDLASELFEQARASVLPQTPD